MLFCLRVSDGNLNDVYFRGRGWDKTSYTKSVDFEVYSMIQHINFPFLVLLNEFILKQNQQIIKPSMILKINFLNWPKEVCRLNSYHMTHNVHTLRSLSS